MSPLKVVEAANISLQTYSFSEKIAVLFADLIPLFLMALWLMNFYPLIIAFMILGITLTFGFVKYGGFIKTIQL